MSFEEIDWKSEAESIHFEGRAFINGGYVDPLNNEWFDCHSPVDGRLLSTVASCDSADVDLAVANAKQAFESGVWSKMDPAERKNVLIKFSGLIEEHAVELSLTDTLDMGKPIVETYCGDIVYSADAIRWCAEAVDKIYDQIAPTASDEIGLITREPVGVVGVIVPWNYPLLMACWKLGPALAAGNSVVLKPSEKSPLSAIRVASLALQAGIPPGVLNVVPGFGNTVGQALGRHLDVDAIAFTGSTKVAKQLLVYAGESNMKRVWMEAGGKSPNIVFSDAPDLRVAAETAAAAIAQNQGEVCSAGSRLLVQRSISDKFIPMVAEAMAEWRPGNPLDPKVNCGALVDKVQMDRVLEYIELGQREGAKLLSGGSQLFKESGGTYVEPAIFVNVKNSMRIAQEEIFGPVLSIIEFDDVEDAIRIANDTPYGLAAGVWTSDISKAHLVAKALRAGSVWVNQFEAGDMTAPFGGFKQSGNGRDKSLHAFDKYTELKATWIKL